MISLDDADVSSPVLLHARRRMSRRATWVTMAVAASVAMAGCGGGSSGSSKTSKNSGSVVIGWEGGLGDPFDVTVGNGYLKKRIGSDAQLKQFASGPAALAALASGDLQYMCGFGLPPTISAIAAGVPLEVIFAQERYTTGAGLVVKKGSGIKSLADLKGRKLGLVVGSTSSFELAEYLKSSGIAPNDIKQMNMSPQQIQSAWTTGSITAALTWNPVLSYLASHDGVVLKTDADLPRTASTYNVCVANKTYAAAHPSSTKNFLQALGDGVNFVKAHPQQAYKVMAKEVGTDVPTAKKIFEGYETFSLAEQATPTVLGTTGNSANSAVAKSMISNWKNLHDEGFQPAQPPSHAGTYINSSHALKATDGP